MDAFVGEADLSSINETLLVLIVKISTPINISQYRPISLCSVVYKTITKIIANKIQPLLPLLLKPNQCSFIPGRLIIDNIIIAQEIVHSMRFKKGKKGFVAMKVDLEKAYD